MPAPIIAAAGKVTTKAIAKKLAGTAAKSLASSAVSQPQKTGKKTYAIISCLVCIPLILGSCGTLLLCSVPTVLSFGNTTDKSKPIIEKFVKLQDEIYDYAYAIAKKKANERENELRALQPTPEPPSTPNASVSPQPTPQPTPRPVIYTQELAVISPPWRVLVALYALYMGQNPEDMATTSPSQNQAIDTEYIESIAKENITYSVDDEQFTKSGSKAYAIYVDTSCSSIESMARTLTTKSADMTQDDKVGFAQQVFEFLSYYDDDGTQLDTPYYDLGGGIVVDDPIVTQPGCVAMPYFNQAEARWNSKNGKPIIVYPKDKTIRGSGCGPTSMAMIIVGLTGNRSVNPLTCFSFAVEHGWYKGDGTYPGYFADIGKQYNIKVTYWWPNAQRIIDALQKGHPIVGHMGKAGTHFPHGHFIVLKGVTADGKIIINDPGSRDRTKVKWDVRDILAGAKGDFAECEYLGEIGEQ